MPHLEPSIALSTAERSLRQLMAAVFTEHYGPNWIVEVAKDEEISRWKEKADVERKKRTSRGVVAVSGHELDYAEFYQLRAIVDKQWHLLAEALGDKKVMSALLARLDDLRNTIAHSREVLPFEADLLAGIAGEVRNRVTLYMSSRGPGGEYYPRIESVTDSFGHVLDGRRTLASSNPLVNTEQTLDVGDVVTFQCRATDPQGRDITWRLALFPGNDPGVSLVGGDEQIAWTVTDLNVSDQTYVQISMTSNGPYHRWPDGRDGLAMFLYRVRPPF